MLKAIISINFAISFLLLFTNECSGQLNTKQYLIAQADSLDQLAKKHYRSKDYDSAYNCMVRAAEIYSEQEQWKECISSYNGVCTILYGDAQYGKFRTLQDSIYNLAINKLGKSNPNFISVLVNMCASSMLTGDNQKAIEYGERAISIKTDDPQYTRNIAKAYQQMSYAFKEMGNYQSAIEHALVGIEYMEQVEDAGSAEMAFLYFALASHYQVQGSHDKAIEYYNLADELLSLNGEGYEPYRIKAQIQIAQTHYENENLEAMKKSFQLLKTKADKMTLALKADFNRIKVELSLLEKKDNYDEMIALMEESRELNFKAFSSHAIQRMTHDIRLLGEIASIAGRYEEAERYYTSTLDSIGVSSLLDQPEEIEHKFITLKALSGLIDVAVQKKDLDAIKKRSIQFRNLIRVLSKEINSSKHKLFWAEQYLLDFEKVISALIKSNELELAFSFMEENKSNLLANKIEENLAKGYAHVDNSILENEKLISLDISNYISKMSQEKNPIKLAEFREKKIQLEKDLKKLVKMKYEKNEFTVSDVRDFISDQTGLIEYFVGDNTAFVLLITSKEIKVREIFDFHKKREQIFKFYSSVSDNSYSTIEEFEEVSNEVYNILIGDLLSKEYVLENLIVVPDDVLNNGDYLGFSYNLNYQYSGKLMKLLRGRQIEKQENKVLAYAYQNPLESISETRSCTSSELANLLCSKKELKTISSSIGSDLIEITENASKNIFEKGKNSKIVHLATHACMDSENPDFSKIHFDDAFITSIDLQHKELNAELVVLSACETGFGKVAKGEGSMSIAKGFFHAGCKSALVSLWPIDDCTTSELMTNLKLGQAKDEALKNAKKAYLQSAHTLRKHPYYWSGFVLIGDASPLYEKSFSKYAPFGIVGLVALSFLFLYNKRKSA